MEKIRFSLKTSKWMYGPECDRELYFYQSSHSSCFPYFRVVLIEIGLIEGFP